MICVWAKAFNDNLSVGTVYRLEHINISDLDSGVSEALAEQAGNSLVSSLGFSVTNDYRDSKLSPTKGWDITNSADIAGGPLGGDKNFYRLQTSGEYYYPIKINDVTTVLEISGRTGIVQSYPNTPDVPIFERYFTGGRIRSVVMMNVRSVRLILIPMMLSVVMLYCWAVLSILCLSLKSLKVPYFLIQVMCGIRSGIMVPAALNPVQVLACVSRPLSVLLN